MIIKKKLLISLMDKIQCGTSRCSNAATHFYSIEKCFYCEHCFLVMCNKNECEQLGSIQSTYILTDLWQDILANIKDYVSSNQLKKAWVQVLHQLKEFKADLSSIKSDLRNATDSPNPEDLIQIQWRASDLKMQIKNSEVFSKYLVHKELIKLRFKNSDKDNKQLACKTARVKSEHKTEEEKSMIWNSIDNIDHFLDSEPIINKELEDFKLKHDEEIKELKRKHKEDEAKYEKEREDLLNQRIEIELELQKLKDQHGEQNEDLELISYEVKFILLKTIIF